MKRKTHKSKKQSDAEKFARRVAGWRKRLAPEFPHIDPHDLELIIAELLKTPEERIQVMFLKRRDEGFLSFDEAILTKLVEALAQAEIDAILFDNTAALDHGLSAPRKKIDLLVHNDARLKMKLKKFAQTFGVALTRPYKPFSKAILAVGRSVSVDFVLVHSSRKSFEGIQSRARKIRIGKHELCVATQEDIVDAEKAANLPRDSDALQILQETLQIKHVLEKKSKS